MKPETFGDDPQILVLTDMLTKHGDPALIKKVSSFLVGLRTHLNCIQVDDKFGTNMALYLMFREHYLHQIYHDSAWFIDICPGEMRTYFVGTVIVILRKKFKGGAKNQ